MKNNRDKSARARILQLFLNNIGKTVSKERISEVAQISEWARRIRELRDEFGYEIQSHKDNPQLKPGEYILVSDQPKVANRRLISKDQWYRILNRDNHTCQSCGRTILDTNPLDPSRKLSLHIDHIVPISITAQKNLDPYEDNNLITLCSICNEGKSNLFEGKPKEAKLNLLALIRRSTKHEQYEIYNYLKNIFKDD